jgi:hypothetical protein
LTNVCPYRRPPNATGRKLSEETKRKIGRRNKGKARRFGMFPKTSIDINILLRKFNIGKL